MLHRAFVYLSGHPAGTQWPEMAVFFELPPAGTPFGHLQGLVALAWGVPAGRVEAYNIVDEAQMRANWGMSTADDAVLLQVGDGPQGRTYCAPDRTQVLTGPTWAARLAHARQQAEEHLAHARRQAMRKLLAEVQ